ncbi:V-set and transmembrane domain-containing protein 4 [Liparis tanakae]|uniref:V-set and transmembrane domain-containing protein 4 n=1 Tax=Liparis tanakae TaxID=230148 RepID=A0A4Z2I3K9_9TELE|nr:V-set and transmembrane domain-containing protein 4 [Liparis tanakae]
MYFSIVVLVLTKALVTEVCHGLNVTVTPGPVVMVTENDNVTLSCTVSQRKRSGSVLILRWFFSPLAASTPVPPPSAPSPSPPALESSQFLIVKMGIKKIELYGNYTRRFPHLKFRLYEETEGEMYRLWILNVTAGMDQGFYTCRVQEIRKHKNIWRASSNGTSTTQLTVHFTVEDCSSEGLWRLYADVYLCAVLICSLGLLSIFMFTLVLTCQYFHRRHRLKDRYLIVRCPESSSGETVTSSSSSSSSSPRAQRKEPRHTPDRRAAAAPQLPQVPPPHIPAKVPVAAKRPQKPRRLKTQIRSSSTHRVSQEDSLTYAELELVRPRPEPPASSSPDPAACSPDTVYAQIVFQDKPL